MNVRHVMNREDYKEYEADKLLHNAYKIRDEVQRTHSIPKLVQMWADHFRAERQRLEAESVKGTSVDSPTENPNGKE